MPESMSSSPVSLFSVGKDEGFLPTSTSPGISPRPVTLELAGVLDVQARVSEHDSLATHLASSSVSSG